MKSHVSLLLPSVMALGIAGAVSAPAAYAAADATKTDKASPAFDAVAEISAASRVAAYARRTGNAEAMIVAARMLGEVPTHEGKIDTTVKGGHDSQKQAKPETTVASLLDEATDLAHGDQSVLAQIASLRASASKGFVRTAYGTGPVRVYRQIPAGAALTWEGIAQAGEPAIVGAVGDGDTDVDIKVFDANGHEICEDIDNDYTPVCRWTPAWTGKFSVEVINNGDVWTGTAILSN